jgi:hypothetical protein
MYKTTAAIALVALLATGCIDTAEQRRRTKENAEINLGRYLQPISDDFKPLGCSDIDSDGDRYVSCDAQDLATKKLVKFECGYHDDRGSCKQATNKTVEVER